MMIWLENKKDAEGILEKDGKQVNVQKGQGNERTGMRGSF